VPFLVANNTKRSSENFSIGKMAAIFSSDVSLIKFEMGLPLAMRLTSGISKTLSQWRRPRFVMMSIVSCVLAEKIFLTKSSSRVVMPILPLPPRLCAR
jgi:hypothetical protein